MSLKRDCRMGNLLLMLLTAMCYISCAVHSTFAADTSFVIKNRVIHKIDPRVFGQFMERPSWGEIGVEGGLIPGTRKLQPGVLKMLEEMEIPIIRFPGGTDVDFMDWRDMVDNVPGRTGQRPVSTRDYRCREFPGRSAECQASRRSRRSRCVAGCLLQCSGRSEAAGRDV